MKLIKHIPNILTFSRLLLLIPILILIQEPGISRIISLCLFALGAISDWLDGKIARKYKLSSPFGEFLDPLVDKIFTLCIFIFFVYIDPEVFPFWMVWLIAFREFLITIIRIDGFNEESQVKTLMMGKVKTVFQFLSIIIVYVLLIVKDQFALYYKSKYSIYLQHNILHSIPLWKKNFWRGYESSNSYVSYHCFSCCNSFISLFWNIIYL